MSVPLKLHVSIDNVHTYTSENMATAGRKFCVKDLTVEDLSN
jgi:hypothetical protein